MKEEKIPGCKGKVGGFCWYILTFCHSKWCLEEYRDCHQLRDAACGAENWQSHGKWHTAAKFDLFILWILGWIVMVFEILWYAEISLSCYMYCSLWCLVCQRKELLENLVAWPP
jgi:hypothetical protein